MAPKNVQSQEQRRQRLAVLRSRHKSRLATARRDAYLTSRRASLNRERDVTQSRINIMTRILGPQYTPSPSGPVPADPIDLRHIPDYIFNLQRIGNMAPRQQTLTNHMRWVEYDARQELSSLNPNLVNPYLRHQELAEMYAYGLGKGVAARTGMKIVTMPAPPPMDMPVKKGQIPRGSMEGNWEMREYEAAVQCASTVGETGVTCLGAAKLQAAELEEIRKLEAELESEEPERKDSPLQGIEGSVEKPIDLDTMNSGFDTMSLSLFGDTTKW